MWRLLATNPIAAEPNTLELGIFGKYKSYAIFK